LVSLRQAFRSSSPEADTGWIRLIVPVTDLEVDVRVLQLVERVAQRKQVEITIVYVVEVMQSMPLDAELPSAAAEGERVLRDARQHVAGFVDARKNVIRTELLQARATGHAIVDEAIDQNADVIILGAKLQRKHGRLTVGETIDYVLHHAPCEVVVLRNRMPDWLIDALEIDYE
jgi:nucleotide-binding universal stress UspA family protein